MADDIDPHERVRDMMGRTLSDVKAGQEERVREAGTGLPEPGTPGDPALQILDVTGESAPLGIAQPDPLLVGLLDADGTFEGVPEITNDQVVGSLVNSIAFEMLRDDGREVFDVEGAESIDTTPEEVDRATAAAHRVLSDLEILRHPFADLRRLQIEQAAWSAHNFEPIDPPGHVAALGMGEESGEMADAMASSLIEALSAFGLASRVGRLLHFQLKGEQGIRYTPAEIKERKADAAADVAIYLVDFCTRNDIDLADAVRDAWAEVSARDWAANPIDAAQIARAGMPAPKVGDTGVTFEPLMRVRCTQDTTYKEPGGPATVVDGIDPGPEIHVITIEEGDMGTIASITDDGQIVVVWDDIGDDQPREVLHLDIEPIEHSVEPDRPDVIHYADHYGEQVSSVGTDLDEALAQGGVVGSED